MKRNLDIVEIKALTKINQAKNKLEEVKGSEQAEYGYVVIFGLAISVMVLATIKSFTPELLNKVKEKILAVFA